MKIPYSDKTNEELSLIYKDYVVSKNEGIRCESFVPYAKEIKENIGGDFTLAEAIRLAKLDFFEEVCNRFLKEKTLEEQVEFRNEEISVTELDMDWYMGSIRLWDPICNYNQFVTVNFVRDMTQDQLNDYIEAYKNGEFDNHGWY